jgi:hypothetical protein
MSEEILESILMGMAVNNNENLKVFVELFNENISNDDFDFNFDTIIDCTVCINRSEFIRVIEKLQLSEEYKQKLYNKGLEESIKTDRLEYMKECLKLLKNVNITDYMIFDAIVSNNNEVVKYLIENGYYTKYEKVMNYASKNANHNMVIWLLKHYDISNFDNELFIGNIHKNYEEINKTAFLAHFSPGVFKYDNDFDSE